MTLPEIGDIFSLQCECEKVLRAGEADSDQTCALWILPSGAQAVFPFWEGSPGLGGITGHPQGQPSEPPSSWDGL